ncbi:MAG: hypothetical protein H7138_08245 [Myxococcales bacterium]|nr:hypothetical protein [Myxococcales bacterium]
MDLLGPLGPMGDPAQREQEEVAWATRAAGDTSAIAALIDLVRNPVTADERGRVSNEALQAQLVHILALVGVRAPETVLERVGLLTNEKGARPTAIEVLGAIGDPAGLRWLAPLVDARDLSEDEAAWLASALGDIEDPEAKPLLERLRSQTLPERAAVLREIQIALDSIARRADSPTR